MKDDADRFLPLSPATLHILLALAGEELHGEGPSGARCGVGRESAREIRRDHERAGSDQQLGARPLDEPVGEGVVRYRAVRVDALLAKRMAEWEAASAAVLNQSAPSTD